MMTHYNGLSPEEAELLALLAEECGEVIQIVGKILRHGKDEYHPNDKARTPNRALLAKELGDVHCAVRLLEEIGMFSYEQIVTASMQKRRRVIQYLHHARVLMI